MLTLISAVVGAATNLLPSIMGYFEKKQDFAQELKLMEMKITYGEKNVEWDLTKINAKADADEGESLRAHDSSLGGSDWIETLRASVRPVITYFFFLEFLVIKSYVLFVMLSVEGPVNHQSVMNVVWDTNTQALFAAVMGFWFGGRMIKHFQKKFDLPWLK
jgi:hypothetical protein